MSDQHKEWEDDGRTVADMSGLDRPTLFGHKEGGSRKKQQEASDGDYVPPLSRDVYKRQSERRLNLCENMF